MIALDLKKKPMRIGCYACDGISSEDGLLSQLAIFRIFRRVFGQIFGLGIGEHLFTWKNTSVSYLCHNNICVQL